MTNSKQDLRERCSYMLILFKAKDIALFEKYTAQLTKISAEESTEFYHFLLAEYKKLIEGPAIPQSSPQPQKPVVKVEAPKKAVKKVAKKVVKKAAKKVTKKVTKKAAPKKKTTKKPAKKAKKR